MKLNLLPTTVSREKTARRAWVIFVIIILVGIGLSAEMVVSSQKELDDAKNAAYALKPSADEAKALGDSADEIVQRATPFVRNVQLVKAIDAHLPVYPDFYAKLKPYIPNFFRVTAMQAQPIDGGTVNVTLTGVIKNQEMYNDLVFALLRIPTVTTVTRTQIPADFSVVPNLTPLDMTGRIHKQSEAPIPDDIDARLNQLMARGSVTGFMNQGNFGTDGPGPKGAMPNYNSVTVAFTMPGQLLAPNIRAVLASIGSASAGAAAAAAPAAAAGARGAGPPGAGPPGAGPPGAPGGFGRPGGGGGPSTGGRRQGVPGGGG